MKKHFIWIALLLIVQLTGVQLSVAQQNSNRPGIGLTLSGGGAKGLAHVGILQAIDKAGLKVDFITGTSMGSIIGALYAAGYSGDSIEQIARAIDWELLFSTSPGLNQIGIEEKSEYNKYALEVPFENGKFKIGKGIIEGQELWLKLSELFEPVYNITDFSKLPIPFKCIGTDLSTGNAVEMDHGNIVTSIRASMAIPSVFTPVRYDDKILVDGGVVNNFPVMNVKNMGADYVIGVNVSGPTPLLKAEELESALDILLQIGFFKDAENFEKNKANCNLYIIPDLKDYSTGSFAKSDSIIDLGIEAGKLYYPYFKKLADSLNALYPGTVFIKDRLPQNSKLNVHKYTVRGLKNTTEKFFFGLLDLPDKENYSREKMNESIRRVYGSRYYRIIKYDFLPLDSGKTEMHFNIQEYPLTSIKFALNYNNFTKLGLKFNITSRDLFLKESRALASIELGENPRLYLEYYKYINKKRTTRLNLNYYAENIDFPVFDDFRLYETLRSSYRALDFQLQHNVNRSSYVGLGQQHVFSKIKTKESPSLVYNGDNDYWYTYLSYVLNNVDNKYFPTSGWFVKAEAGYVYDQNPDFEYSYNDSTVSSESLNLNYDDYAKIFVRANHYSPINTRLSFNQSVSLAYLIANTPYIANNFLAGGVTEIIRNQVPFVGLDESEVKTGSIATLQLGLQYNVLKSMYLTGRFNAGLYDFHNTAFSNLTVDNNLLTGYGLTFGYDSVIGPIELTGMYCDQDGKVRTSIRLGFNF